MHMYNAPQVTVIDAVKKLKCVMKVNHSLHVSTKNIDIRSCIINQLRKKFVKRNIKIHKCCFSGKVKEHTHYYIIFGLRQPCWAFDYQKIGLICFHSQSCLIIMKTILKLKFGHWPDDLAFQVSDLLRSIDFRHRVRTVLFF